MIDAVSWPDLRATRLGVECVLLEIDSAGLPMNVMTPALIEQLGEAVARIAADPDVNGAVIASGKSSGFMAGADLNGMSSMFGHDLPDAGVNGIPKRQLVFTKNFRFNQVLRALETSGKVFVCAIDGVALGGGCELAVACHARIVADHPGVRLGLPEVSVGLLPGAGGTQRLPRLIGTEAALDLLLSGRMIGGREALEIGLVDRLVAREELIAAAEAMVQSVAPRPPWGQEGFGLAFDHSALGAVLDRVSKGPERHFRARAAIARLVADGMAVPFDEAIWKETEAFVDLVLHPQSAAMIDTLFVAKQAALRTARKGDAAVAIDEAGPAARAIADALRAVKAPVLPFDEAGASSIRVRQSALWPDAVALAAGAHAPAAEAILRKCRPDGPLLEVLTPDPASAGPALALAAHLRAIPVVVTAEASFVDRCALRHAQGIAAALASGWAAPQIVDCLNDVGLPVPAPLPDAARNEALGEPPKPDSGSDSLAFWLLDLQADLAGDCIAQGMLASEQDANLAAVFGWGMPGFTGGPFGWKRQRDWA